MKVLIKVAAAVLVVLAVTSSQIVSAGTTFVDGEKVEVCQGSTCGPGGNGNGGEGEGGGNGVGIGIAEATANATATVDNTNTLTNQQQQQQNQTQTATGGNANATGGSVNVGDTTLSTGPSTSSATGGAVTVESGAVTGTNTLTVSEGAVQNSATNTNTNNFSVSEGAVQNTNTAAGGAGGAGGNATISEGAVQNSNTNTVAGGNATISEGAVQNSNTGTNTLNVAEGAVTAQGGNASIDEGAVANTNSMVGGDSSATGGSLNVEEGAVDNTSSASTGDVTVNNNFGGEEGTGALSTQNVEGSTQVVEGSTTNVQVDASTDFRGAPVASVAPVFSNACSGGMSFQARELGVSVGDAEYYCKLLQLADARFAQSQTIVLVPPEPPVVSDCTGNVPDYTKGSRADTDLQKQATISCFRQNQAAMEEYAVLVEAYNQASMQRTELMNQAYQLVNDAEEYVRSQSFTSNLSEQSRKVMTPLLVVKAFALLFL